MSYATTTDYQARYGAVDDVAVLQVCLDDATALINANLAAAGIDPADAPEAYANLLKMVCREVAHRAFGSGPAQTLPFGVTQTSQTAGPYTQSFSFGNPYGDMFLTKSEKKMLGIAGGYIGSIEPVIDKEYIRGRW